MLGGFELLQLLDCVCLAYRSLGSSGFTQNVARGSVRGSTLLVFWHWSRVGDGNIFNVFNVLHCFCSLAGTSVQYHRTEYWAPTYNY